MSTPRRLLALSLLSSLVLPACSDDSNGGGEGGEANGAPASGGAHSGSGGEDAGGAASGGGTAGAQNRGSGGADDGSGGADDGPPPPCVDAPSGLMYWWSQVPFQPDPSTFGLVREELQGAHAYTQGSSSLTWSPTAPVGWGVQIESEQLTLLAGATSSSPALPFDTVEFWFRATRDLTVRTPLLDQAKCSGCPPESTTEPGYTIVVSEGKLQLELRSLLPEPGVQSIRARTDIDDREAHHVVVTLGDPSDDPRNVSLYVDGALEAEAPLANKSFPTQISSEHRPLLLGRGVDHHGSYYGGFLGFIDEVSLYARALTAGEVAALYDAQSSGKCGATPPPDIF